MKIIGIGIKDTEGKPADIVNPTVRRVERRLVFILPPGTVVEDPLTSERFITKSPVELEIWHQPESRENAWHDDLKSAHALVESILDRARKSKDQRTIMRLSYAEKRLRQVLKTETIRGNS